jgi:hypothetical protein
MWQHPGMGTRAKRAAGLADPTHLKAFDKNEAEACTVIIETPKGSRNKYAFDPEERIFALKKVLPAGMAFPYDFGFVPSTRGGDGDPLDVLVLMDEPAFPGCKITCRVIGVIECVIHAMSVHGFSACRSSISRHAGHRFHAMSVHDFTACRSSP